MDGDKRGFESDARRDCDEIPARRPLSPTIGEVIEARLSRREALGGMLAAIAAAGLPTGTLSAASRRARDGAGGSSLTFQEVSRELAPGHRVSAGYRADVLLRWGDPVLPGAPAFDPHHLDPAAQALQAGYNCDYIAYMPLPRASNSSTHGLLCVSHEYTNPELMWSGIGSRWALSAEQVQVELMAHGHSVVEIELKDGVWSPVTGSAINRRITALTPMRISGPAAGHARMRTGDDPAGRHCIGTINNCAGGVTPWGTVLIAEENFNYYFSGDPSGTTEAGNHRRYGVPSRTYNWGRYHERFDVAKEPHEANRFGWVVEFDPYDPSSAPVKRTALGRFKHEGATAVVNRDGRVVVYSGDDQVFEYVYRFTSARRFDPRRPEANRDLLDDGTLSVARFDADGTCRWLPLVWGRDPLTPANGFDGQGDVLIETRRAADLVGATPMDRPEDVEPNPLTGKVYVMLTKNAQRDEARADAANPRAVNRFGHIIELEPPAAARGGPDHAADTFKWNVFLRAGDPDQTDHSAVYHPDVSRHGWLVNPDNAAFDNKGRLWIATDQGEDQPGNDMADGMWATDTEGGGRALTRMFFACPVGAEMCGPCFTPDGTTMFLAVQHPGEGTSEKPSTFDAPLTRWPDFADGMPPRPTVVAVRREDAGEIGS